MFDHITIRVKNFARSRAFYESALAPLGYKLMDSGGTSAGFGNAGKTQLWIEEGTPVSAGLHVAFASPSHKGVQAFHAAALKNGGRDNGGPGLRESYSPTYYAAFAHDPDGNNIEAVCHGER